MTDNEIIKALECWINHFDGKAVELETLCKAFTLINRQKAEIDRLKKNQVVHIDISEQFKKECEYEIKIAKSEAIKEFAERLKKVFKKPFNCNSKYVVSVINAVVKEMVGDERWK